ncbi:hypothetical protein J7K28_06990 [Candidatus Aerophobetes bacterium]|nr:hypothetical protein [Candidatus Aerophobetes bacterium]
MKNDKEKLKILLEHWIKHNNEHLQEFQKWAKKAKVSGNISVHNDILRAVEKMREVNKYLANGREKLE